MIKKMLHLLMVFTLVIVLSACSSLQLSTTKSATNHTLQNIVGNITNPSVKNKLAVGMLKLEGTDLSITAAQAKDLLPLWKAVKSLNAEKTTAAEEMVALYVQIQETMTSDQIQYIDKLDLTSDELDTLMQKYEVQIEQTTQSQMTTTHDNNSYGGGGPQGCVPGLDMPPDAGLGGLTSGGPASSQSTTQQAPVPAQSSNISLANSNVLFANTVIKLLEQRASS
jgi:uncharacterized protein YceK